MEAYLELLASTDITDDLIAAERVCLVCVGAKGKAEAAWYE
jgi:hypothetical protein